MSEQLGLLLGIFQHTGTFRVAPSQVLRDHGEAFASLDPDRYPPCDQGKAQAILALDRAVKDGHEAGLVAYHVDQVSCRKFLELTPAGRQQVGV